LEDSVRCPAAASFLPEEIPHVNAVEYRLLAPYAENKLSFNPIESCLETSAITVVVVHFLADGVGKTGRS